MSRLKDPVKRKLMSAIDQRICYYRNHDLRARILEFLGTAEFLTAREKSTGKDSCAI